MQVENNSIRSEDNRGSSNELDRYVIFEVVYDKHSPAYLPKMLMNICFKFLVADRELRDDIRLLLQITANVNNNSTVIEFEDRNNTLAPN